MEEGFGVLISVRVEPEPAILGRHLDKLENLVENFGKNRKPENINSKITKSAFCKQNMITLLKA